MSCMPDMTPTRTSKIVKNGLLVFERGENLIVRNCVGKLEFKQTKKKGSDT